MDTRAQEVRFLATIQALATSAQNPRTITKALQDLPESGAASESVRDAVMAGASMDRLRSIVKSSQGDSRRGRAIATRLLEWMDEGRPAEDRAIAKANLEVAKDALAGGKLNDGYLNWQRGTNAYHEGTSQGILEEPKGFEHSQSTDIPRKEEKHKLPGNDLPLPGTTNLKYKKPNPKTDLVD